MFFKLSEWGGQRGKPNQEILVSKISFHLVCLISKRRLQTYNVNQILFDINIPKSEHVFWISCSLLLLFLLLLLKKSSRYLNNNGLDFQSIQRLDEWWTVFFIPVSSFNAWKGIRKLILWHNNRRTQMLIEDDCKPVLKRVDWASNDIRFKSIQCALLWWMRMWMNMYKAIQRYISGICGIFRFSIGSSKAIAFRHCQRAKFLFYVENCLYNGTWFLLIATPIR